MTYVRSTDGTRIHYSVTGRPGAPPILFIQGLGADKHGWDLQRLGTAPWYNAVALDNRGAGRSDKPHGPYSLEQMADDAIAVLDAADVQQAHVMGLSMGGMIVQQLAIDHRDRLLSMTSVMSSTGEREYGQSTP
ncbi:MAG: alpha/beta hydrolase, partial [Ilumatobacteraceae bacterium]